jgi:hypothetical protein
MDPGLRGCNPINVFWIGLLETGGFLEFAGESPSDGAVSAYHEWWRFGGISRNRTEFHHRFPASQLGYILLRREDGEICRSRLLDCD